MEIFTADGSMNYQIDGGIEIAGGTSDDRWKQDKLSMRIKFKEPYGPEKFNANIFQYGILDEGAAIEFNTLTLDAQSNYTWQYGGGSSPLDQRGRAKYIQDQFVADLQNLAGGKAQLSFDERFLAVHQYVDAADNPQGLPANTSNIFVADLKTGRKYQVTKVAAGQKALYPHFRADGWLYFLVRESSGETLVGSDIAIRLGGS